MSLNGLGQFVNLIDAANEVTSGTAPTIVSCSTSAATSASLSQGRRYRLINTSTDTPIYWLQGTSAVAAKSTSVALKPEDTQTVIIVTGTTDNYIGGITTSGTASLQIQLLKV